MAPRVAGAGGMGSNMLVHRELLIRIGLFDESLGAGEDAELCYRALDSGATLVSAPSAVVSYRLRDSPTAVYRQARLWAYWDLEFYRRYRSRGATKRSTRSMIRSVWWIASRSPFVFRNPGRRIQWFEKLGTLIGHTRGMHIRGSM
jgi:GT2 family glycosyltransferase